MGVVLLAALLFPLPVTASQLPTSAAVGDFTHARASIQGDFQHWTKGFTGMFVSPDAPGFFQWTLTARQVDVHWTQYTFVEQGRPTNLSDPQSQHAVGPPTYGEEAFPESVTTSSNRQADAHLLGIGKQGALIRATANETSLMIRVAQDRSWIAGREANVANPNERDPTSFTYPMGPNQVEALANNGDLRLTGNFSLYVWESDVRVQNANGTREFRSGTWVSFAPTGSPWAVWERKYQLLRLNVTDGSLLLSLKNHGAKWTAHQLAFEGNLAASFEDATGNIRRGTVNQTLTHEPLNVAGAAKLLSKTETLPGSRVQSYLELANGTVASIQKFQLYPVPKTIDDGVPSKMVVGEPSARPTFGLWIIAAIVLLPIGVLIARASGPRNPSIPDVEWALLNGQGRRAHRLARRLVRREPQSADAVFLFGATLFLRGRFAELVESVETIATSIPRKDRTGIAYLLAVSSTRLGDMTKARRWASEAAAQPELLAEMKRDGNWAKLVDAAVVADSPDQAYA